MKWTNPFPFQWLFGGSFHFYSNVNRAANSGDPDQTPPHAASALDLHCLHMSHKKNAMFNRCPYYTVNSEIFARSLFSRIALNISSRQSDFAISQGLFREIPHPRSFAKIKHSRKFSNLQ